MILKKRNILIVDDEPKIREVVSALFESKGFTVFSAENGVDALEVFRHENISLVVLDLMMPEITGEKVCAAIRKESRAPIIMLTAKVSEENILEGFECGADDYVTKPFRLKELYARAEAVLRRTEDDLVPLTIKNSWRDGDLVIDFEKCEVFKNKEPVALTPSELKILSALIKYPGKVFTRDELVVIVLKKEPCAYDRVIDNHIKNIRKKIEDDPKHPNYVVTVSGIGYRFGNT